MLREWHIEYGDISLVKENASCPLCDSIIYATLSLLSHCLVNVCTSYIHDTFFDFTRPYE
jgi:hypothetical protein